MARFVVKGLFAATLAAVVVAALAPQAAEACSTCFGDPESPMTKGMNTAIAFLLGVITSVLAMFAGLFVYWMRRVQRNESAREEFVTQGMVNG